MRRAFTRRERASLEALARVLLPSGEGMPGADDVGAARCLDARVATWRPGAAARIRLLVGSWEWSPLLGGHARPFSALSREEQGRWTERCYRSRAASRRLQVSALKQLLFLEWASAPEVESALSYDYVCRKDGVARGTSAPARSPSFAPMPPEPGDYHRPGPATDGDAVPLELVSVSTFRPRSEEERKLDVVPAMELGDGFTERVQVVVVGSGAGGAVAAATLAERGVDVVVVEEGPPVTKGDDFKGPMFGRFARFCRDHALTQVYGRPPIPLPLGRVVGGTTVVNSGTCFRAPRRVLDRWAAEHGADTSGVALTPHYEEIEHFLNVRPVPWELLGPNGLATHEGAVNLGYSGGPLLRNITDCHGCGQCAFGCPTDAKQAMHISYLPRAQRAGARIYSGARVDRVLIDGGRATGVKASIVGDDGSVRGELRIEADAVVVCAGAIHTPALLDASDVPDQSGQTGRNLRIHPATGVAGRFQDVVDNWKGTLQSYYVDQFFDSHELMFEATTTIPSIGAGSVPGIGRDALQELSAFRHFASLGFYVSDTSAGRVRRLPSGEVAATYRLNALDTKRMAQGLVIASEILLAAGAERVYPGIPGIESISGRADIEQLRERTLRAGHLRLTAFHPMGTVRMGADPRRSVVDARGRHHAVEGLWVGDASTFPSCVGVNPQMTIMALARRTAEHLSETL